MKKISNIGMDREAVAADNIASRFGFSINIISGEIRLEYSFRTYDGHYGDAYDIVRGADDLADAIKELRNCSTIKIDGADAYDLCINNNCAVETEQGMVRGYALRIYKNMEDEMVAEYKTAIASKWTKSVASWAADLLYGFLKNIADEMNKTLGSDVTLGSEDEQDVMGEILAAAQDTFDNYVMDLQSIADNYGALETALDYYAAKQIAERIKDLGESLLSDLGAVSGCEMCEEDGYWFDTAEFERWAGGYTFDHIDEIENLIDTLEYYITDAPLGFDKDTLDFELGGYEDETSFLGLVTDYPCYLWDELRDFISTSYHYAYCA